MSTIPNNPSPSDRPPQDGEGFDLDALLADAARPTDAERPAPGFAKRVMDAIEREDSWRSGRKGRLLRWLPASVAAAAALLLGAFLAGRESAAPAMRGELAKADDLSSMNEHARAATPGAKPEGTVLHTALNDAKAGDKGSERGLAAQSLERDLDGERAKLKDRESQPPAAAQAPSSERVARADAPTELAEESVRRLKSSLDEAAPAPAPAAPEAKAAPAGRYRELAPQEPSLYANRFPRSADGRIYVKVAATSAEIEPLLPRNVADQLAQASRGAAARIEQRRVQSQSTPSPAKSGQVAGQTGGQANQAPSTQAPSSQSKGEERVQQSQDDAQKLLGFVGEKSEPFETRVIRLSRPDAEAFLASLVESRRAVVNAMLRDAGEQVFVIGDGPITPPRQEPRAGGAGAAAGPQTQSEFSQSSREALEENSRKQAGGERTTSRLSGIGGLSKESGAAAAQNEVEIVLYLRASK